MTAGVRSVIGLDWIESLDLENCALLDWNPCDIIMVVFKHLEAIIGKLEAKTVADEEEMNAC
jgi:hypothetical protein